MRKHIRTALHCSAFMAIGLAMLTGCLRTDQMERGAGTTNSLDPDTGDPIGGEELPADHQEPEQLTIRIVPNRDSTVSIFHLLVHGEKYHGRRVAVSGFLMVHHSQDLRLFLHEEDANYYLSPNSVAVSFDPEIYPVPVRDLKDFHRKYVRVYGVFKDHETHFPSVQVQNVDRIDLLEREEDFNFEEFYGYDVAAYSDAIRSGMIVRLIREWDGTVPSDDPVPDVYPAGTLFYVLQGNPKHPERVYLGNRHGLMPKVEWSLDTFWDWFESTGDIHEYNHLDFRHPPRERDAEWLHRK